MRTKKALFNIISGMGYQMVAIICGLITPRLILYSFGSTYNGVINSATQFLNMINILTFGITGTTRVALYKTLANYDMFGTSRIMKATKIYMQKVGVTVVIYALLLCLLYPLFAKNDLTRRENMLIIAIVSIGTFAQFFFGLSNTTLLNADQASYIVNTVNIIKTLINTICVAILIWIGASIFVVKLGSSIIFFIAPVVLEIYVRKKYSLTNKCESDNVVLKGRGAVVFHQVANIIHDNTDIVILTLFVDAKLISVYTVYYLVIGKVKTLLQVFTSGMEAAFGQMLVKHEMETLQKSFRTYEFLIFSFTAVVFSCVGVLILPFVSVYTQGITDVNYYRMDLAILITITEAAYCVRQPYLLLVYAAGKYKETRIGAMLEAAINVCLSLILVQKMGIVGVVIGTLVANIFRTVQYSYYISKNILHRDIKEFAKRVLWLITCILVSVFLSLNAKNALSFQTNWSAWIVEAIMVFSIALLTTAIMSTVSYRNDQLNLISYAKRAITKRG